MKGNRFSGLSPDTPLYSPPNKRSKPISLVEYPDLPVNSNPKNPKFILISAKDESKPLKSVSIFVLRKAIDGISKEYESITQLQDGNILILTKNKKIAEKFIAVTNLANQCPVTVKYHERLNASKGIVYAPCLINISESEIVSEMSAQNVTDVYKFKKKIDGKLCPSGLMLFTFDMYQPPSTVEIGWYKAKVNEYIPNPMRCRNCQLLGHTTKRCTKDPNCETCNLPPHSPATCTRTMCANCLDSHPSSSLSCPKYKQNKEILTIKTRNKCTMSEAKRLYNIQNPLQAVSTSTPYAGAAKLATKSGNLDNAISHVKPTTNDNSSINASIASLNEYPSIPYGNVEKSTKLSATNSLNKHQEVNAIKTKINNQTMHPHKATSIATNVPSTSSSDSSAITDQTSQNRRSILPLKEPKQNQKLNSNNTQIIKQKNNETTTKNIFTSTTNSPLTSNTNSSLNTYYMNISDNDDYT